MPAEAPPRPRESAPDDLAVAPEVSARIVGRAASWAAAGHVVSQLVWFASLLVLAALLPPRALGAVSAAMVVVNVAILFIGSGSRGAIITSDRVTPEQLRYALAVNVGTGLLVAVAVGALAGPMAAAVLHGADPAVLRALALSIATAALSVVPLALLQRQLRFRAEALVMTAGSLTAAALAIAAGAAGAGVWALVLRQVLSSVLVAALAWAVARPLLPPLRRLLGPVRRPSGGRGGRAGWFFLLAVFSFAAMSSDYVVVGRLTDATQLGLYSLAFTLGFAPLTNFSWRLGGVLLPAAAAAAEDPAALARRTVRAVRLTALLLLPLVVPAIVLAPTAIPLVLGERWSPMVVPFQILLPAGVAHAVLNMVGESLGGSGDVDLHARMHALWAVLIVPSLVVLVHVDGIRGAALAHLVVLVPVAAGYLVGGGRRLGLGSTGLARGLASLVPPLLAQVATTLAVLTLAGRAGLPAGGARALAAAAGAAALAALLLRDRRGPLGEGRALLAAVVGR